MREICIHSWLINVFGELCQRSLYYNKVAFYCMFMSVHVNGSREEFTSLVEDFCSDNIVKNFFGFHFPDE